MLETLAGKTMRTGRMVTIVPVAMLAAPGLAWCLAVIGHLYFLRRGELDVCCADD